MAIRWKNDFVIFKDDFVRWVTSTNEMPPELHASLIDPYSGGAWIWLVEITIPGYSPIRYARNTENVIYAGALYTAYNFQVGIAKLASNGSVPRISLSVAQDANCTLEDKVNATQGAGGGTVKIIRTHEDFFDTRITECEQLVRILTCNSDTQAVYFQLGIPNPLLRKIPLRRGSSKICPYATPSLFKGPECQYAGGDATCVGTYEACCDKSNEEHWGGEIGLDPSTMKV